MLRNLAFAENIGIEIQIEMFEFLKMETDMVDNFDHSFFWDLVSAVAEDR